MDANRRVFGIQDVHPPSTGRPLHVRRRCDTSTEFTEFTDSTDSTDSTDRFISEGGAESVVADPADPAGDTEEGLNQVCECLRLLRTLKLLPEDEPSDDDLSSEDEPDWGDFAMRGSPSLGLRSMLRTERKRMAAKAPPKPKRVDMEETKPKRVDKRVDTEETKPKPKPKRVDMKETKPMWWKDMERTVAMWKAGGALNAQPGASREMFTFVGGVSAPG